MMATATAPDEISTSTPVAYAPPCALTSALNAMVTTNVMSVKMTMSGRFARAHSGAMP